MKDEDIDILFDKENARFVHESGWIVSTQFIINAADNIIKSDFNKKSGKELPDHILSEMRDYCKEIEEELRVWWFNSPEGINN